MFIESRQAPINSPFMRARKSETHPTFAVLEKAANEYGIRGPTAIGAVFGVTSAVINNWRTRGIPEDKKLRVSVAFRLPVESLQPEGMDELDLGHLKRNPGKSSVAAAIKEEARINPYALITQGLEALVILEDDQQEVLKTVRTLAEKSEATRRAWQERLAGKAQRR